MTGQGVHNRKKTVLISPINWGLGHASRLIPIVSILEKKNYHVIILADGAAYFLLQSTFPDAEMIRIPLPSIRYSRLIPIWAKMLLLIPGILLSARHAHRYIKKLIRSRTIDLIISDNHYGVYSRKVYSIFITHQLFIKLPRPLRIFEPLLYTWHRMVMRNYKEVWVPDFASESKSLAGRLSHPKRRPRVKIFYMGPVSRFTMKDFRSPQPVNVKYDVVVVLSGPEPHRSILEQLLLRKLRNTDYRVLFLRGIPWKKSARRPYQNIRMVTHLDPPLFKTYLSGARYIIARSGYTTIMDLLTLGKKALLIPTPGQPEQEYLSHHLTEIAGFVFMKQDTLNIETAFDRLDQTNRDFPKVDATLLQSFVTKRIQDINHKNPAEMKNPPRKPV